MTSGCYGDRVAYFLIRLNCIKGMRNSQDFDPGGFVCAITFPQPSLGPEMETATVTPTQAACSSLPCKGLRQNFRMDGG